MVCSFLHFLRPCSHSPGISHQLTERESICHKRETSWHSLSTFYAALIRTATGFTPFSISWWKSDLAMQFTDSQKEKILHFARKFSISTKVQETSYQILTRCIGCPQPYTVFFRRYLTRASGATSDEAQCYTFSRSARNWNYFGKRWLVLSITWLMSI